MGQFYNGKLCADKVCKVCNKLKPTALRGTTCFDCIEGGNKYCASCDNIKPIEVFHKKKYKGEHVYGGMCKECHSLNNVAHRKSNCDVDKEYRDRRNEYEREWHREHYYNDLEYRQRALNAAHNRRAHGTASFSASDWSKVLNEFDYSCAYCGSDSNIEQDHVVAASKGGSNLLSNFVPACSYCNKSKGSKDMVAWYTYTPYYNKGRLKHILEYLKRMEAIDERI